jgi:hypothetical protein
LSEACFLSVVVVVGVVDRFVVVFCGAVVLVMAPVVVVACDDSWRRGAELDDVVNENTKTRSRSGLDQITQCVLLREGKSRILVLAG